MIAFSPEITPHEKKDHIPTVISAQIKKKETLANRGNPSIYGRKIHKMGS
jgi:hypothetical protein